MKYIFFLGIAGVLGFWGTNEEPSSLVREALTFTLKALEVSETEADLISEAYLNHHSGKLTVRQISEEISNGSFFAFVKKQRTKLFKGLLPDTEVETISAYFDNLLSYELYLKLKTKPQDIQLSQEVPQVQHHQDNSTECFVPQNFPFIYPKN